MSLVSFLFSLVLVSFSFSAFAGGEIVPCPERQIGDQYVFTRADRYGKKVVQTQKIVAIEGESYQVLDQNGQIWFLDPMFNVLKAADGRVYGPKYYSRLECPFTLGESRTYSDVKYPGGRPGAEITGNFTVVVDQQFSTVTVPAGTFKVVKIVSQNKYLWRNTTSGGRGDGYSEFVSYYSPELGFSVKSEMVDRPSAGNLMEDKMELTEHSIGKK